MGLTNCARDISMTICLTAFLRTGFVSRGDYVGRFYARMDFLVEYKKFIIFILKNLEGNGMANNDMD